MRNAVAALSKSVVISFIPLTHDQSKGESRRTMVLATAVLVRDARSCDGVARADCAAGVSRVSGAGRGLVEAPGYTNDGRYLPPITKSEVTPALSSPMSIRSDGPSGIQELSLRAREQGLRKNGRTFVEATFLIALGDAMERSATATDVMLIDEVARALKITPKQIRRLERRGAFPIPRLPKLDRHPRYARCLVERFAAGEVLPLVARRRRIA